MYQKSWDWKITYLSKDTIENNWANKPKVSRTSSTTGTQNKTKVNEIIIAKMWKDGDFVDVSRGEFQTSLAAKDDYVWIVKGKTDITDKIFNDFDGKSLAFTRTKS